MPDALRAFCVRLRVCARLRLAADWLRLCVFDRLVLRVPPLLLVLRAVVPLERLVVEALRAVEPLERLVEAVLRRLVERLFRFWL